MNTDELEHATYVAERRVLEIQTKLHRWLRSVLPKPSLAAGDGRGQEVPGHN